MPARVMRARCGAARSPTPLPLRTHKVAPPPTPPVGHGCLIPHYHFCNPPDVNPPNPQIHCNILIHPTTKPNPLIPIFLCNDANATLTTVRRPDIHRVTLTPTGRAFEGQGTHTPHTAHRSAPHTACPRPAHTRTHAQRRQVHHKRTPAVCHLPVH